MNDKVPDGGTAAHTIDGTCSVEFAIGIIGGKWKLLVIRLLLYQGPMRYNELLRGVSGISNKVLTENLRELEAVGVVARAATGDSGQHHEYALTPSGEALLPLLKGLGEWADQYGLPAPTVNAR